MKKTRCRLSQKLYIYFLIILISSFMFMESSLIYQNAAADKVTNTKIEPREYKATANQEMLIIEPNDLKTIDLYYHDGQALEFIYKLYVQEELPIDVWFVNDENYTKFINGNEYKYFIDGSEEQVISTTKVVSVTEYNEYKLMLINYNETVPVKVDIIYEGRVYDDYSSETVSKDSTDENALMHFLLYPLVIAVVILAVGIIALFIKVRRSKHPKDKDKAVKASSPKKSKTKNNNKIKKDKSTKAKGKEAKPTKKSSKTIKSKIIVKTTPKKTKSKVTASSNTYCGYCGKPMSTPFCTGCGKATHRPLATID